MITRAVGEITKETAKHKFGGDPVAEYMYSNDNDQTSGSVEWDVWFAQSGKRIVFEDDRGFVWVTKYKNEAQAIRWFELLDRDYSTWARFGG